QARPRRAPTVPESRHAGVGVCGAGSAVASDVHLEHGHECLLRNLHVAHPFHAALAFALLLEQLALPRDVAAVAFGKHVLAHGGHGLTGDDLATDRCLYGHFEELTRDQLAQTLSQLPAVGVRAVAMDDHAQRVDALTPDEDVELDQRLGAEPGDLIIQ